MAAPRGSRCSALAHSVPRAYSERGGHATPGPQIGTHDYVRGFWSRPDLLPAPVSVIGGGVAPGYLAVGLGTAKGSVAGVQLVDHRGEPVFYQPISTRLWTTNPGVFRYRGEPVLTWWEGSVRSPPGYGAGEGVIVDGSYRELARVRAANGRRVDMHEYRLTPDGTALFTCYPEVVPADLSAIGGASNGRVLENIIQEVDIRTGKLLMEWRSLDHVPISETFRKPADPLDYLHANSIDIAADGNLLVSGRHTWSVYKLDRRTGEVIWRLGGKRSDFAMGKGSQYSWQHHARAIDPTTISVFDNGADGATSSHSQSRGVLLSIDEAARTVRLSAAYEHPDRLLANAMGSVEKLPNGNVLIGWGEEPCATEFAADGTRLSDAVFPVGQKSYRAFRLEWKGTPRNAPAIAARPGPGGHVVAVCELERRHRGHALAGPCGIVGQASTAGGRAPADGIRDAGVAEHHAGICRDHGAVFVGAAARDERDGPGVNPLASPLLRSTPYD